jgi:DNA polymerase-4
MNQTQHLDLDLEDYLAQPPRAIVHMDLDTFFVSVERLKDSRLKAVPILIGGQSERGVVASCSYETRQFGVHAGMPMRQARQLCPEALVLRGDYQAYVEFSDQVRRLVAESVPVLEFASIDEFYLDLTGMDRYFGCWQFAQELRERVMRETGLPLSLGQANCKAVAKVATGEAKPCNSRQIERGHERSFLAPLSVRKLPGAGEQTCLLLRRMGVIHVFTLQQLPVRAMEDALGQPGRSLWLKAQAADPSPVVPYSERKQIGTEETFERDTIDIPALHALLTRMAEQLAYQLRASERLTACITVKIRYANFDTETRQQRIPYTALDDALITTAKALFDRLFQRRMLVRLIGVSFSHLVPGGVQLNLLTDTVERTALLAATDRIRNRFGAEAIQRAVTMNAYGRQKPVLSRRGVVLRGDQQPEVILQQAKEATARPNAPWLRPKPWRDWHTGKPQSEAV